MAGNWWLLLEKSDDTRISKGIDAYRDNTGEQYQYDSLVPNHRNLEVGDSVIIRKEDKIVGGASISRVESNPVEKIHRRCPECRSTDIRDRKHRQPRYKCGGCSSEFEIPFETTEKVISYTAYLDGFHRFDIPPGVKEAKRCSDSPKADSSQLSILRLNPQKVSMLLSEVLVDGPTQENRTGGQGFGLTATQRKAIETHSMNMVRMQFEMEGWSMIDRSRACPYDFLAIRNGKERFIEVKGTTGPGNSVILTAGEVAHVLANPDKCSLVVITGVQLEFDDDIWIAHGGAIAFRLEPWNIIADHLVATQYMLRLEEPG